jgi:hypothetical protein
MAEVKRYAVVTQLSKMASIRNSFSIEGRAILTEDIPKGERKAANVVTSRTNLLVPALSTLVASVIVTLDKGILNLDK